MHVPLGPIVRSIFRRRVAFASLVLEVAFGLTVVHLSLALTFWFLRQREHAEELDGRNLFVVELEATADDAGVSRGVRRALEALPGVERVAWLERAPFAMPRSFDMVGPASGGRRFAWVQRGAPEIGEALGVELIVGRFRPRREGEASQPVVMSETLARLLFGEPERALGAHLDSSMEPAGLEVTGIFKDVLMVSPAAPHGREAIVAVVPEPEGFLRRTLLVRVRPEATSDFPERVRAGLSGAAWSRVEPLGALQDNDDRPWRAGVVIPMIVVLVMLIGALVGTFGMSAYSVTERTRQIGIRRALGATRAEILVHFLVESWLMTSVGLVLGIFMSYGVVAVARRLQPDLALEWPFILIGVVVFWTTGLVAAMIPALDASRVPPVAATRNV